MGISLALAVSSFLPFACAGLSTAPVGESIPSEDRYPPPSPDFSSLATANPPDPIDFISESGQFNVTFPCCDLARKSLTEFTITTTVQEQSAECTVTVLPEGGATWSVKYCDLSTELSSALSTQEALNWARDDALQGARARLKEESTLTGDFETILQGRLISAEANMRGMQFDGTMQARVYFTGKRVYEVVAVVYNENWGNRLAMMESFLDSFYIHTALTIPFEPTATP